MIARRWSCRRARWPRPLSFHAPRRRPPLRPSPLNRAARPAAPSSVSSHVAHARFLPGEYATPPADLAVVNSGVTHIRYLRGPKSRSEAVHESSAEAEEELGRVRLTKRGQRRT